MDTRSVGLLFRCINPLLLLLCSCAQPARYVVISEDVKNITWENPNQRYICLNREDARNNTAILGLYTKAAIHNYEQTQTSQPEPAEEILSYVIREDYKKAAERLSAYQASSIPKYLELLVKADLAFEGELSTVQPNQLVRMYQEAFDLQTSDLSRTIIEHRIRQLRYRR